MKKEKLSMALGNISSRHIEEALEFEANARSSKKSFVHWGALVAACFIFLACLVPVMQSIEWNPPIAGTTTKHPSSTPSQESTKNPSQTTDSDDGQTPGNTPPLSMDYSSIQAAHSALGFSTLYENISLNGSDQTNINIVYQSDFSKPDEEITLGTPREMLVQASYTTGDIIDIVDYYIIFGANSVDDSYIGGYSEQGRRKEVEGITVHYSVFESGSAVHAHAKFVYEGNLYVIHVKTLGRKYVGTESAPTISFQTAPLFSYLDQIFGLTEEND